jgi:hypothetical protein
LSFFGHWDLRNRPRHLADVQWNFATLLLVAHAREALGRSLSNGNLQICCQSHLHETPWPMFDGALLFLVARARGPWPCSMKLCNFVASRTRERPLAMFNATLQSCCQSHAHETPWPMFDGALRFLVARARGPWPCSMELCSFAASHARARPLADVRLNFAI